MLVELGATIAIIQDGQVLLTKREDFEIWCLPGGAVDPGESLAQAAIREAREETGLDVELTRLVGIYSNPERSVHQVLFVARAIGGVLCPAAGEVIEMGYFAPQALPQPLISWHRQKILDVFAGVGGSVVWRQHVHWPFDPSLSRQDIYQLRDESGLSRLQFLERHFQYTEQESLLEVAGAYAANT